MSISPILPENIILIDKPKGITSFDVIRALRRKMNIRKMGHAGTLDPLATGLMIIGINEGTKKLSDYLKLPKTYDAEILFGIKTDSGDVDGKIIEEKTIPPFEKEKIEDALHQMIGKRKIQAPMYSALKVAGKPLYKYARAGDTSVVAPEKEMEVRGIEFLGERCENQRQIISARIDVSSGTYIRSLAEEIGKLLGVPATIKNLRRIRIGEFTIEQAETI
ncbi:MAG: tRNA pseudouridine(55) synthase TruB [Patescibacteria group bacterium]